VVATERATVPDWEAIAETIDGMVRFAGGDYGSGTTVAVTVALTRTVTA
jgi:hypothetical protein